MNVNISKDHRTALFIAPGSNSERVSRLKESLNGDNIKVDIYGVSTETTSVVKRVDGAGIFGLATPAIEFDIDAIRKEASAAGYDQILFSVPA